MKEEYEVHGQTVLSHPRIEGGWRETVHGGCNTCNTKEPPMMFHLNSAQVITRYCPRCLAYLFSQLSQHVRRKNEDI